MEINDDKHQKVIRYIANLINSLKISDSEAKKLDWDKSKDPVNQLVEKLKSMRRKSDSSPLSSCPIELPQSANKYCATQRQIELDKNAQLYKLSTTHNYNHPNRKKNNPVVPYWDSEVLNTFLAAMIDPNEWRWLLKYFASVIDNASLKGIYSITGKSDKVFTSINDWIELFYYYYNAHVVSHFYLLTINF